MKRFACVLITIICVVALVILFNMHTNSLMYLCGELKSKPMYYCPLTSQLSFWVTILSVTGFGFIALALNMNNTQETLQ